MLRIKLLLDQAGGLLDLQEEGGGPQGTGEEEIDIIGARVLTVGQGLRGPVPDPDPGVQDRGILQKF